MTVERECNGYAGAKPFYTITRWKPKGDRAAHQRFTPSEARAEVYERAFLRDETDAETLGLLVREIRAPQTEKAR